jgi:small subunit ribosomal protein S2e
VSVRLVPAPRGTGIVAAKVPKRVLQFAGIEDVYTRTRGSTKTLGNFVKATFEAISQTYAYLSPDLWTLKALDAPPFQLFSDWLLANQKQAAEKKVARLS